jgi:uncharacterized protein YbjT (DUF2867 family)
MAHAETILITGATGNIGREAVRLLSAAGERVRALTRTPAKAATLGAAEVAEGDLTDAASVARAMAGAARALVVVPGAEQMPAVAPIVFAEAKKAGLAHVVFVSSGTIGIQPPVAIGRWHLEAEAHLKATGVAWTMLRPGNFASNALRWAATIRAQGAVYAPSAGGETAPIDPRDIAAVAAAALTRPGHAGATHVLTGEELLSPAEQVEAIGKALGRTLRFVELPEDKAREGMVRGGVSATLADALLELHRAGREGRNAGISTTVRDVTGRPARRFGEWVADHVEAFR